MNEATYLAVIVRVPQREPSRFRKKSDFWFRVPDDPWRPSPAWVVHEEACDSATLGPMETCDDEDG